jgi:hypothetical protein
VVWVCAVPLVLGGCGVIGGESSTPEVNRVEQVPVELSLKLRGDVDLTVEETVTAKFVVRRTSVKEQKQFQIMGVESVDPVRAGPGLLLAGFALQPFQGDGEYTIEPGSALDAAKAAQASGGQAPREQSSVRVIWWPTGNLDEEPEEYQRRAKACTAEVDGEGTEGVLRCPDVTTEARDKHFSLELRWRAPTTPAPTTTPSIPESSTPSTPPATG